jgi:hypothetical protein
LEGWPEGAGGKDGDAVDETNSSRSHGSRATCMHSTG